jgi:hypothetical protein
MKSPKNQQKRKVTWTNKTKIEFFPEVKRDGWFVRMSIMEGYYILSIIRSELTGQVIIRYFDDETIAAQFIDYICELDSSQEQDV